MESKSFRSGFVSVGLSVLLIMTFVTSASAQGLFGGLPGLPPLGGFLGRSSGCPPTHEADCSVAGNLGYMGRSQGLVFDRQAVGANPGGIDTVRYQYPVEGVWLGASVTCVGPERGLLAYDPRDGLCLTLGASWLFPNNTEATETINRGFRTWSPKTQWYTLDASVSRCAVGDFSLIGGFRYDSFSTKFSDPARQVGFTTTFPTDEAELVLSSYIPYLGAVLKRGAVEVGVIGFPWVWGRVESRETIGGASVRYESVGNYSNAYFLETFAEFGGQMGMIQLWAFAKYTVLHAKGNFDFDREPIGGVVETAPNTFGMDRQNWIVGGKALIGFNSPL
jgi:hypothetical protein